MFTYMDNNRKLNKDDLDEIKKYVEENPSKKICLYFAEKTQEAWDISTSRVYMNQLDNSFAYLPVNIKNVKIL